MDQRTPKHTPGPWSVISHTIVDSDGDSVIEVLNGFSGDLRLAASAPELLEALQLVLADNRLMNALSKQQARAVLDSVRKATGGTP